MTMHAAGGWCAPSNIIYEIFTDTPRVPYCPEWRTFPEDECDYHDCTNEYKGEHRICVCEFCGATRIIAPTTEGS